ncbi:MAG TPA: hypothetical protein EYQ14_25800 [Gammaproteobacteria bacterium]|nr:hypothetical protein [Gammaproteobacteria bacterium]
MAQLIPLDEYGERCRDNPDYHDATIKTQHGEWNLLFNPLDGTYWYADITSCYNGPFEDPRDCKLALMLYCQEI